MQGHSLLEFKFAVESLDNTLSNEERLSYHTAGPSVFEKISNEIKETNWDNIFEGLDCEESFECFSKIYHELCMANIKSVKRGTLNKKSVPWISYDLRNLIRDKHKLWYNRSNPISKAQYKKICKEVKVGVKAARLTYEEKLAERSKREPKLVYKYMNGKLKSRDQIRALRDTNNKLVVDSKEMAEVLNDQFKSVFKNDK